MFRISKQRGAVALLCGALIVAGGLSANAASMTTPIQTKTIPLTQTDWNPSNIPAVNPLTFTKFDPTLGTLLAVNIGMGYQFQHDISMTFANSATLTVTSNHNEINLTRPNSGASIFDVKLPDYTNSQTYSGPTFPHTVTLPTHVVNGNQSPITLTSPSDLALFTQSNGSTSIGLPATATANSVFTTSSGNGSGFARAYAMAGVAVSYTYEPAAVPEPSTLAVLSLGLGGLLVVRHYRKTHAA